MEPNGSSPHSQVPTTCPYPEPAQSSPYPHIPLPKDPSYILPSTPGSSKWYQHQNPVYTSSLHHTCYMPYPSHPSRLDHRTILGEQYGSLSSLLCSSLHSPLTLSLLDPNIVLNTLFSDTLSLCSSPV